VSDQVPTKDVEQMRDVFAREADDQEFPDILRLKYRVMRSLMDEVLMWRRSAGKETE
jgi:hypothetical protein